MAKLREKKGVDLAVVVERLERARQHNPDGKVTFEAFQCDEVSTVMETFTDFSRGLPRAMRPGIVTKAFFDAAKQGPLSVESLNKALHECESSYLGRTVERFYVLFHLSLKWPEGLSEVELGGQTIRFGRSFPKEFHREGLYFEETHERREQMTRMFTKAWLMVEARCAHAAFDRAQERIDLLRAVWNLRVNSHNRMSSGFRTPVNQIILGPVHTVHRENGEPAGEVFWYEPEYPVRVNPYSLRFPYTDLAGFTDKHFAALEKVSYGEKLGELLVRFCRALDKTDFEAAFVRVWGVVEALTHTDKARYEQTIERTVFLFKNRSYHKCVLEHLRDLRNASVHRDQFSKQEESALFQLKMYAEALFRFHIFNGWRFSSLADAADFLSLSSQPDALLKRVEQARFALEFIGCPEIVSRDDSTPSRGDQQVGRSTENSSHRGGNSG